MQEEQNFKDFLNMMLLEKIAAVEHEQWVDWSKTLAEMENLSDPRVQRWIKLWKPYDLLSEQEKEQDRIWARKIISLIEEVLKLE